MPDFHCGKDKIGAIACASCPEQQTEDGSSVPDRIAKCLGVNPGTINRTVKALERDGIVRRPPVGVMINDRLAKPFEFTEVGARIASQVRPESRPCYKRAAG